MDYRSRKTYRTEEVDSMGNDMIKIIGNEDNMVTGILSPEEFALQYEVIPE